MVISVTGKKNPVQSVLPMIFFMQVINLKLDGRGEGEGERECGENGRGGERRQCLLNRRQNRTEEEIPKLLILLFNVVKLANLSVQRLILPFL